MQFYPGDWWRANDIKGCSMATQGVWFNLLMAMWDAPEQGKIRNTIQGLARIIGSTTEEVEYFLKENKEHKFASVTIRNKFVTIKNRRMYKEYMARIGTKERVKRHREHAKQESNTDVTLYSSTSSSIIYTLKDVTDSAVLVGIPQDKAEAFFHHYNAQGWLRANNQKITDLYSMLVTWRNNQYKFEKGNNGNTKQRTQNNPAHSSKDRRASFADQKSDYGTTLED